MKSIEKIQTLRNKSPKIDHLYSQLKHNSTIDLADENTIIKEIRYLGQDILQLSEVENSKSLSIYSAHNLGDMIPSIYSQQNLQAGKVYKQNSHNLYDKYKNVQIKKQRQNVMKKSIQQVKNPIKIQKKSKLNQHFLNVQSKFKKDIDAPTLNYKKYAQRVINKKIKQQKEQRKLYPIKEKHIQPDKVVKRVLEKGEAMLNKKGNDIQKIKEEKRRKQMHEVTFKPKVRLNQYNKLTKEITQDKKLKKFYQRQILNKTLNKQKQQQILHQQLRKTSFHPKLIYNSKLQARVHNSLMKLSQFTISERQKSTTHCSNHIHVKNKWNDSLQQQTTETNGVTVRSSKQLNFLLY